MNCYLHPDTAASAYCRSCGRPLCEVCQRPSEGTVFCQEHAPAFANPGARPPNPAANPNPYFQNPPAAGFSPATSTSPGLAFLLGWIPGVGAIYNGQYMKGLVHAIIFGLLITLISNSDGNGGAPLFSILLGVFYIYMPFEAFHTAKKRQLGVPVDEWSSLVAQNRYSSRAPVGPIVLILLGVLFLLDTLHVIEFHELARFWPVLLIVVGAFMLYNRVTGPAPVPPPDAFPAAAPPFTEEHVMEPRHE